MKVLILLSSCLRAENRMSSSGNERLQQYKDGLIAFFKYIDWFRFHNMTIVLTDNTCTEYHPELKELVPPDVAYNCVINNLGIRNKGVGLIGQWINCIDIIKQYEYVIHYEPRQILLNLEFFKRFIEDPISLFTINPGSGTFNTGLIAIESRLLVDYINSCDLERMNRNYISIEDHLFQFMKDKPYKITDKMNLLWLDGDKLHSW